MRKKIEDFEDLKQDIEVIINKIQEDQSNFIMLPKSIIMKDNQYAYRIDSCISNWYFSNEKWFDDLDPYNKVENLNKTFANIIKLIHYINNVKGFDYQLNKKTLCMLLGITINKYQELLGLGGELGERFKDIEEYLISNKLNSGEAGTRNIRAIDNTLSTKGEFGGHDVEKVSTKVIVKNENKNVIDYKNEKEIKKLAEDHRSKFKNLLNIKD